MNLPKDLEKYIQLYLYDELTDAEKKEFEAHISFNEESRKRLAEQTEFHQFLNKRTIVAPTEATLLKSRAKLRERLQQERKVFLQENLRNRIEDYLEMRKRAFQFAGAFALLLAGFFIGLSFVPMGQLWSDNKLVNSESVSELLPRISNIDLVQYDPKTGQVKILFKTIQNIELQGNADDERIRKVLSYAIRTETHPGRRLAAVKAIGNFSYSDAELETALIQAMENDEIEGVRLKAAKILQQLPLNERIKKAFIQILLKDPNPALRIEAINALSTTNENIALPIFENAAEDDANEFVRLKASKVLERQKNPVTEK